MSQFAELSKLKTQSIEIPIEYPHVRIHASQNADQFDASLFALFAYINTLMEQPMQAFTHTHINTVHRYMHTNNLSCL